MIRLIGILTGSALAIAVLIVALGMPRLSPPDPDTGSEPVAEPTAEPPAMEPAPVPEPGVAEATSDADTEPASDAALVDQLFAPEETRAIVEPVAPVAPEEAVEENWYAFWSPFRSELAANGFVAKLQETTGLDYRVVKVRTGVYEVAFAYTDDEDIEAKLERIANATGLDMSGG